MPLLANSQTLSTDTLCKVPCNTLKKALIVKTERDYLKNQITVVRDSVSILNDIVLNQNNLILNRDSVIVLYKDNELRYKEIITNKDQIIEVKDKQVKKAKNSSKFAWITTGASAVVFLLILL